MAKKKKTSSKSATAKPLKAAAAVGDNTIDWIEIRKQPEYPGGTTKVFMQSTETTAGGTTKRYTYYIYDGSTAWLTSQLIDAYDKGYSIRISVGGASLDRAIINDVFVGAGVSAVRKFEGASAITVVVPTVEEAELKQAKFQLDRK